MSYSIKHEYSAERFADLTSAACAAVSSLLVCGGPVRIGCELGAERKLIDELASELASRHWGMDKSKGGKR